MEITRLPIDKINPAAHNPRRDLQPNDPEYKQIEASIEGFGLVEPLVWNRRTGNLVGGHQRFKILVAKGLAEVEVSVVDLDLDKEKVLNIALNKVQGDWDGERLAILLEELSTMPDLNVRLTGFKPLEISQLMDRYFDTADEDDFDAKEIAESIEDPVTQKGDLIELGPHRVLCGDCSILDHFNHLFSTEKAGLVYTDPPYNVDYAAGDRPNSKRRTKKSRRQRPMQHDRMAESEYHAFLCSVFSNIAEFINKGTASYVWNGHKNFGPMHAMLESLDFHIASVIVWAKPSFAISYADYSEQVEFCLYGWLKDNGRHRWFGSTGESTLWECERDPNLPRL